MSKEKKGYWQNWHTRPLGYHDNGCNDFPFESGLPFLFSYARVTKLAGVVTSKVTEFHTHMGSSPISGTNAQVAKLTDARRLKRRRSNLLEV